MIWRKEVQEPYFTYLLMGIKIVEGRLNRDDWAQMETGDEIIFVSTATGLEAKFKIIGIHEVSSFDRLYALFGRKLLPKEEPSIYRQFFTQEDEEKYGVVGVQLEKSFDHLWDKKTL